MKPLKPHKRVFEEKVFSEPRARSKAAQGDELVKFDALCVDLPLQDQLEQLLEDKEYAQKTLAEHPPDPDGNFTDVYDAERYRSHPLFGSDTSAIAILMAADEYECCNPVGVWKGLKKVSSI